MQLVEPLRKSLLKILYRAYLWSFANSRASGIFAVSERIVEYPFAIENIVELPKRSKIAVLGCHGDMSTTILSSLGYEISGVDVKPFPLHYQNFRFYQDDIRKTRFADNFFDAVIAISTIEHVGIFDGDDDGDKKAVAEMIRILKPYGLCVITVPFAYEHTIIPTYQRIYDKRSLRTLLVDLQIEKVQVYAREEGGLWEIADSENVPRARKVECVAMVRASTPRRR
jgi:SAM-dependent methyltransferase